MKNITLILLLIAGLANAQQRDSAYSYNFDQGLTQWVPATRYYYTYNGLGNKIATVVMGYDSNGQQFINTVRYLYDYDTLNLVIGVITQQWDSTNWNSVMKKEIAYNQFGKESEIVNSVFNADSMDWYLSSRFTYNYNLQGGPVNFIIEGYDTASMTWYNGFKTEYIVNGQNLPVQGFSFIWDSNTQQWTGDDQTLYTYNSNNRIDTTTYGNGNPFFAYSRVINSYFVNTDTLAEVIHQDVPGSFALVNAYRERYVLNPDLTTDTLYTEQWNMVNNNWDTPNAYTKYFYTTLVGIAQQQVIKATLYPNPVTNNFKLKLADKSNGTMQVEIVDAMGRSLQKEAYNPTYGVDVSHLPSGHYFVKVYTAKAITVLPLIK